jgi:DNA-binding transcriptional LysR family regulator
MELRHLRCFLAVAEELNFTRAARRLHLSQSALSQQIRAAEKIIGGQLFHRDPAGIRLTAAGQALLAPASEALAVVADGVRAVRDAARTDVEILRIGVPFASALGELQQPILSAYVEHPLEHILYSRRWIRASCATACRETLSTSR